MSADQMPSEQTRPEVPIQDELPEIIRALRRPAGDDPRFQSDEGIRANRAEFLKRVHATWKQVHKRALEEILKIEGILTPDHRKQLPKEFVWFLDRTALIWRRVNDALVWLLVGQQDHVIRQVCHRKDRPRLSEANPEPMLKFLERVNADPQTIVIWSDATTCVDVGDIVCKSFGGGLNGFIEVKEGVINDKILDLLFTTGTQEEIISRISSFEEQYGPQAMKQLDRVVRQHQRQQQVLDILEHDRGFSPHVQAEVTISESTLPVESYDRQLQEIIDRSANGVVRECIDRCLWVYADRNPSKSADEKIKNFHQALISACPESMQWLHQHLGDTEPFIAIPVEENLFCPEAIPLFLRSLDPETIRDLLIGRLMHSVFVFFDWHVFGQMIGEFGAQLTWSTAKEGRRTNAKPRPQRRATFGGRIARIQLPEGHFIEGLSKIYRILFEGITPGTIAAQYIEQLKQGPPAESGKSRH
jgi:hypothetical protein